MESDKEKIPFPSCRLIVTLWTFLALVSLYSMRVNLSIAIVVMVNHTYIDQQAQLIGEKNNISIVQSPCKPYINESKSNYTNKQKDGDFEWDTVLQGQILGAFFYGYLCTQFIGGLIAQRIGTKPLLLLDLFANSILTLLAPFLTKRFGAFVFIFVRVLQGLFQGLTFPCFHSLLSKWAPPMERSKMVTFAYAGCQIGTVITNPICGLMASYSWESMFYFFGAFGLIYFVSFYFLIFESPSLHPRIHPNEKNYIISSLGDTKAKQIKLSEMPWKSIFTSLRLYALIAAHFAHNWGFFTMLTCLPLYLNKILAFDLKSNGFIASLPYLSSWLFTVGTGFVADILLTKQIFSVTFVRKMANLLGLLSMSMFLIIAGNVGCNTFLAVFCVVASLGCAGISWSGWSVNHLDIAPMYAGTLMGITNSIGTVGGFAGPAVAGYFTSSGHTIEAWKAVFFVAAAISASGGILFAFFGTGKKQSWAIEK